MGLWAYIFQHIWKNFSRDYFGSFSACLPPSLFPGPPIIRMLDHSILPKGKRLVCFVFWPPQAFHCSPIPGCQEPTLLLSLPKNQRGHQGLWGLRLIASYAHKGPVCAAGVSGCLMPCKPAVPHLCQAWVSDTRWGIAVLRKALSRSCYMESSGWITFTKDNRELQSYPHPSWLKGVFETAPFPEQIPGIEVTQHEKPEDKNCCPALLASPLFCSCPSASSAARGRAVHVDSADQMPCEVLWGTAVRAAGTSSTTGVLSYTHPPIRLLLES